MRFKKEICSICSYSKKFLVLVLKNGIENKISGTEYLKIAPKTCFITIMLSTLRSI